MQKFQVLRPPKGTQQPLKLRPIISSVNSEIEILSIFLDYQLQKVVRHCTGYLRDSWELLDDIKQLGVLQSNTAYSQSMPYRCMTTSTLTLTMPSNLLANGLFCTRLIVKKRTPCH